MTGPPYLLEFLADPAAFATAAGGLLAAEPVRSTVVATVTARLRRATGAAHPPEAPDRWWLLVRDRDGKLVGAGMRTAPFLPYPVYLLAMPEEAALELARTLHDRGEHVDAVEGATPAVEVCATELARLTGRHVAVNSRMRLQEVTEVVDPPPVPGRLREARPEDTDLVHAWFDAFAGDAAEQAASPYPHPGPIESRESIVARIRNGEVWLWEVEGHPVQLTAFNPPAFGVGRIGPVYTPGDQRGKGYAAAATAAVSRNLLATGVRVCLFSDLANPTSTALYERLGYREVVQVANLLLLDP